MCETEHQSGHRQLDQEAPGEQAEEGLVRTPSESVEDVCRPVP